MPRIFLIKPRSKHSSKRQCSSDKVESEEEVENGSDSDGGEALTGEKDGPGGSIEHQRKSTDSAASELVPSDTSSFSGRESGFFHLLTF